MISLIIEDTDSYMLALGMKIFSLSVIRLGNLSLKKRRLYWSLPVSNRFIYCQ